MYQLLSRLIGVFSECMHDVGKKLDVVYNTREEIVRGWT